MVHPITVHSVTIDPSTSISKDSSRTNYIYVQCLEAFTAQHLKSLNNIGVEVHEKFDHNTYLCGFRPSDLGPVRQLGFVAAANCYHTRLKIPNMLQTKLDAKDGNHKHRINVVLHRNVQEAELQGLISDMHNMRDAVDMEGVQVSPRVITVQATRVAIESLKAKDCVRLISPFVPHAVTNNVARVDMYAETKGPFEFQGAGQVICVNDTGFDIGSVLNPHPAFTGRVLALSAINAGIGLSDRAGHGTHVAGSALGAGVSIPMGGDIYGTAPAASLVCQSLVDHNGKLAVPADLTTLFSIPYTNYLSRISNNSWGQEWTQNSQQVPYDISPGTSSLDEFVWTHPDAIIVVAAGNAGLEPGAQITSIAAAKNCITVGATYSSRPADAAYAYDPTQYSPRDPTQTVNFSSRGPTLEGRLKPDVCAPGVAILSTLSRDPAVPAITRTRYGISADPLYTFDSGTSMSTPLVSGCCAVIRQMLIACGRDHSSAALVKGLIINGSLFYGESPGRPVKALAPPSVTLGWGRVDLERAMMMPELNGNGGIRDEHIDLTTAFDTREYALPDTLYQSGPPADRESVGIRVTLVWSDPPGKLLLRALGVQLRDVSKPEAPVILAKSWPKNGFPTDNVQRIILHPVPYPAKLDLQVKAIDFAPFNNQLPSQPFALVWSTFVA